MKILVPCWPRNKGLSLYIDHGIGEPLINWCDDVPSSYNLTEKNFNIGFGQQKLENSLLHFCDNFNK